VKLSYLIRGFPGHPSHPPLTDATIGAYTFATVAALLDAFGIAEENGARAWWLALVVGLAFSAPTVLTGLADWLTITPGTPLKRTATTHALVNATASVLFVLAVVLGHDGYEQATVETLPLLLTLVGFGALAVGGWIGGSITYVHGMRVLELQEEPTRRAVTPGSQEKEAAEKERAEGG
jgi:uncharacterized membrane protein